MSAMTKDYPKLVEALDYEAIRTALLARARQINGWTAELESDPVVKLLEIAAYRELTLRAHINHTAISNLIQFATGSDLDAAAAWYRVTRLAEEPDARFRSRLFNHIFALSGNGTQQSYLAKAMAAHAAVIDVVAYRPSPGKVNVAVWGSADAVNAVAVALTADDVEMLGIDVAVYAATVHQFDVRATVTVARHAPSNAKTQMVAALRARSDADRGFGKPLAASQIVAWLHAADYVEKVSLQAPQADINTAADELWQIGAVDLVVRRV